MNTAKAMKLAKRRKQEARKEAKRHAARQKYLAELKASGLSEGMFRLKRAFDALH